MPRLGMSQGIAAASSARKKFSSDRASGGMFGAIGSMGRKSTSTLTPEQLARSGKMRSAIVAGGAMGMSAMSSRRGPGTSKTSGRPTGIRDY